MILKSVLLVGLLVVAFAGSSNAQQERILRIVSILDQPYLMHGDDADNGSYTGFCKDLAKMISEELRMDYEIHLVKDGKYGAKNKSASGQWNGMIGEIVNNEADIVVAPLTITAARASVVDFSTPFQEFQFSILLKKPDVDEDESDEDETLTAFSPFHLYLWLAILLTVLGMVFISLVIEWSFKSPETHGEGFVNFLRQDSIFRPESITGKVVRFVYLVFIILIICAYTASFAVQREADSQSDVFGIDSIEELVTEDDMKFGIIDGGSTEAYLKGSNDETYTKLYEIIDRENTKVENYAEGLERLRLDEKFAFVIESPKAEFFSSMEPCDLETGREEFGPTRGYAIATRKGIKLSYDVNIVILTLKENGKLETLIRKYWNNIECSDKEDGGDTDDGDSVEKDDFDTLNLSEMAGLFYFLFGGLILILLVWILERRATTK